MEVPTGHSGGGIVWVALMGFAIFSCKNFEFNPYFFYFSILVLNYFMSWITIFNNKIIKELKANRKKKMFDN